VNIIRNITVQQQQMKRLKWPWVAISCQTLFSCQHYYTQRVRLSNMIASKGQLPLTQSSIKTIVTS